MSRNQTQKDAWVKIHGPSGNKQRKLLQECFKRMFPKGHKESLKEVIQECLDVPAQKNIVEVYGYKSLAQFHPRAFLLLLIYGRDYRPEIFKEPPNFPMEPTVGKCHANSHTIMRAGNIWRDTIYSGEKYMEETMYVEGLTIGVLSNPMLHAWNTKGFSSKKAFDWTRYAKCNWSRYFGILFTEDEHKEFMRLIHPRSKYISLLLDRENFPKVELLMHTILARREETLMQEKLLGT